MIGAFITSIVTFSRVHQELAYGLIFTVALSEALPVIGAFVPGDAVILGVSALVPAGALSLWPLIIAATVGAILGDGFSFWLGLRYRESIVNHWPFSRYPRMVTRGETFLTRHGGKSVFIARFTPGVRAIVPALAGTLGMSRRRFYSMNVLSALSWGPVHVLAGAAIGATLVVLGAVASRLAIIVAILIVLIGLIVLLTRYALRRLPPLLEAAQARLHVWAQHRDNWLGRRLHSMLDPARRDLPGLALLAGILVASVWLFLGVLQNVLAGDPLVRANEAVFQFLQSLRTEWVDHVMVVVSELGDVAVVTAVALAAVLWFAWRRNWRGAAYAAGTAGLTGLLTVFIGSTLHVPRPHPLHFGWEAFAFPSGRAAASAAVYGFLAMIGAWESPARWKPLIASVAAILITAIAFARVYLGVHWLSDVLAGVAFGTAWAAFLAIAYLRRNPPPVGAGGLCAFAGAALIMVGTVHVEQSRTTDMRRYAVQERVQTMPWTVWWRSGWRELAARRLNLIGQKRAPLTVQWAGSDAALVHDLAAHGWTEPTPWTVRSSLSWLRPHVTLASLPVLPRLENGRPQALVRILPVPGEPGRSRFVLRLWRTTVRVTVGTGSTVPLFVGTVQVQQIERPIVFLTLTRETPEYDRGLNMLAAAIPRSHLVRRQSTARAAGWDGRVLLGFAPAIR